jgi:multisubunit Na+/H+ antiporter MnhE subunit
MTVGRGIALWLLGWAASAALWMVLTDSVRIAELVAGAAVAALAATATEVVRRQRVTEQALRPRLWLRLPRALVRAVPDVGRLTRAAFLQLVQRKPVRGRTIAMLTQIAGDEPDARARRAAAIGLGSIAPNSIVVGVDPDSGVMLVHQLEPTRKPSDLDPLGLR